MKILFIPARNSIHLGLLYNEAALSDARGLAPVDWRIPTVQDIIDLLTALGGEALAGGPMKAIDSWSAPNTGASNTSGLTALPAGQRDEAGTYSGKLLKTIFWFNNA